jgi:acetylornithine deacetylase
MSSLVDLPLPQSCEELLSQTVSFETVNQNFGGPEGGEAALISYLEKLGSEWGLSARRLPVEGGGENLLLTCEISREAPWLLFESHIDTVTIEGMTVDPLIVKADGDRLYGRGTCDTKGSGATMFWALKNYTQQGKRPYNVGLLFALDEESHMTGAKSFARGALTEFLPNLVGLIVGEPTLMRPVVAHNGVMRWTTKTKGVAAHSADPSKGQSAISSMVRVIDALETRYMPTVSKTHPLTGKAAFSVNVVRGGTQVNIIPEACEIECDRRTVPGESADEILQDRDEILAGMEVEHVDLHVVPAMSAERSSKLLTLLDPVLREHGIEAGPQGAPYVTDASFYDAAGAPTIVIGPGALAQCHRKDEWVSREQLELAVKIYGGLMRKG